MSLSLPHFHLYFSCRLKQRNYIKLFFLLQIRFWRLNLLFKNSIVWAVLNDPPINSDDCKKSFCLKKKNAKIITVQKEADQMRVYKVGSHRKATVKADKRDTMMTIRFIVLKSRESKTLLLFRLFIERGIVNHFFFFFFEILFHWLSRYFSDSSVHVISI